MLHHHVPSINAAGQKEWELWAVCQNERGLLAVCLEKDLERRRLGPKGGLLDFWYGGRES